MSELLTIEDLVRNFPQIFPSVSSVHVRTVRSPESLPPRISIPGLRRVVFQRQTVLAWIAEHETATPIPRRHAKKPPAPPSPATKKRGRPTKAEQIARGA